MIFLPNYFERYTAALRNHIHLSALKHGIAPKHLRLLRKIYLAEALYNANELLPTDVRALSYELLCAAQTLLIEKGELLHLNIKETGNFLINPKLYSALLLTLCKSSRFIRVYANKGNILLKVERLDSEARRLIRALKGRIFYELKTKAALICIPAAKTSKTAIETEKEWEYILNPFSAVNIYLN